MNKSIYFWIFTLFTFCITNQSKSQSHLYYMVLKLTDYGNFHRERAWLYHVEFHLAYGKTHMILLQQNRYIYTFIFLGIFSNTLFSKEHVKTLNKKIIFVPALAKNSSIYYESSIKNHTVGLHVQCWVEIA